MKTFFLRKEDADRKWYLIDADGHPLGRLSSAVSVLLLGKRKPTFTPHVDNGDHVVVVNARKVKLTGKKEEQKRYYKHTGYPGGLKSETAAQLREKYPERLIFKAVKGMLPKNRLGRKMIKKLKVYSGADHPHQAQKPEVLSLSEFL